MKQTHAKLAWAVLMVSLAGCASQTTPLPHVDDPAPSRRGNPTQPAIGSDLSLFGAPLAIIGKLLSMSPSDTPRYADVSQGPILVQQRQQVPFLGFDRITGSLDLNYIYERDTEKQSNGTVTTSTDNLTQETVTIRDHGYILHPNFFDVNAGLTLGLQQESFDGSGLHQYTPSTLTGWDVNGVFLKNQDAPVTVFTQRSEQYITPNFAPSLDSTTTAYGVGADIHSKWAPSQFQASYNDNTQTEPGGASNYELTQDTVHWHTDFISIPDHTIALDYTYQNTREQDQESPPIYYQDNNATLSDVYVFGPGNKDSLSSLFSFAQEQGNRDYQDIRLDENLRLPESKTFETHYQYSFDQTAVDNATQTTNHLQAGFMHRLFESLVTSGSIGGSLLDLSGSQVEQLDGTLGFAYRKKAWLGELFANLDLGWHWQYAAEGTNVEHIINQAQTFTDSQPVVLTTSNINANSIRVFNASGVPYTMGKDYTVNRVGNLIQIQRVLGGLIAADSSALLDYDLNPQPASTINTSTLGAGTRYTFERGPLDSLSPYIRYSAQSQQIQTADQGSILPNCYDDLTVGSDYKIWKITFNAEQDWHRSTLVPYDATRFSARYNQAFEHDTTASLDAAYETLNYYSEGDHVENASVTALVNRRLNQDWSIIGRVSWIDDRDQLFGNSNGLEESLELNWHHRQTQVYLRLRNANLITSQQTDEFQTVEVGFRRNF